MPATGQPASGAERRTPPSRHNPREAAQERARQRMAEQRRVIRRRRRLWAAGGATSAVVSVVAVMVAVSLAGGHSHPAPPPVPGGQAAATVAQQATTVPAGVLDRVGKGTVMVRPVPVTGQEPLVADGKPLILYVGAEYCPYCASQRWAVVVALSRFGTFHNLGLTHSASDDVYPDTQSFSFHGASYTSDHLTFQGVELSTNERRGDGYAPLDTLTDQQKKLMDKFNGPPYVDSEGGIPFMDLGNRYLLRYRGPPEPAG